MIPTIDKHNTAKRISHFMKSNGLKPVDIQAYLSLTCVQTVYRWLEGINIPSVDNLYALSQLFGIRMDDMIAGNRRLTDNLIPSDFRHRLLVYYNNLYEMVA